MAVFNCDNCGEAARPLGDGHAFELAAKAGVGADGVFELPLDARLAAARAGLSRCLRGGSAARSRTRARRNFGDGSRPGSVEVSATVRGRPPTQAAANETGGVGANVRRPAAFAALADRIVEEVYNAMHAREYQSGNQASLVPSRRGIAHGRRRGGPAAPPGGASRRGVFLNILSILSRHSRPAGPAATAQARTASSTSATTRPRTSSGSGASSTARPTSFPSRSRRSGRRAAAPRPPTRRRRASRSSGTAPWSSTGPIGCGTTSFPSTSCSRCARKAAGRRGKIELELSGGGRESRALSRGATPWAEIWGYSGCTPYSPRKLPRGLLAVWRRRRRDARIHLVASDGRQGRQAGLPSGNYRRAHVSTRAERCRASRRAAGRPNAADADRRAAEIGEPSTASRRGSVVARAPRPRRETRA